MNKTLVFLPYRPHDTYWRQINLGSFFTVSELRIVFCTNLPTLYDKAPRTLMWAVLLDARGKITLNGVPDSVNDCVIFIVCTQFTNVVAGHMIQPGGPRVDTRILKCDERGKVRVPRTANEPEAHFTRKWRV